MSFPVQQLMICPQFILFMEVIWLSQNLSIIFMGFTHLPASKIYFIFRRFSSTHISLVLQLLHLSLVKFGPSKCEFEWVDWLSEWVEQMKNYSINNLRQLARVQELMVVQLTQLAKLWLGSWGVKLQVGVAREEALKGEVSWKSEMKWKKRELNDSGKWF